MNNHHVNQMPRKKWPHIKNGLKETCPKCGGAPLFESYLKPVQSCENCGYGWHKIRAELGPAWAAMTLAAHIVIPIYHFFIFGSGWPNWLQISVLMLIATIICLLALPRMKGLFMAIVWLYRSDSD